MDKIEEQYLITKLFKEIKSLNERDQDYDNYKKLCNLSTLPENDEKDAFLITITKDTDIKYFFDRVFENHNLVKGLEQDNIVKVKI